MHIVRVFLLSSLELNIYKQTHHFLKRRLFMYFVGQVHEGKRIYSLEA